MIKALKEIQENIFTILSLIEELLQQDTKLELKRENKGCV